MDFILKSRDGKKLGVLSLRGKEGIGDRYCYFIMSTEVLEAAKKNYPIIKERLSRCGKGGYETRYKIIQSEEYLPVSLRELQELGAFRYYWAKDDQGGTKMLCLVHPEVYGRIYIRDSFTWAGGFELRVVPATS